MSRKSIHFLTANPERFQSIVSALRAGGSEVLCSPHEAESFAFLQDQWPDVVVVDGGRDTEVLENLSKTLKSSPTTEDTAVILLTDDLQAEETYLHAGAYDVLPRAVEDSRLVSRIHLQLRIKARIDELKRLGALFYVKEHVDDLTKLYLFPTMELRVEAEIDRATAGHPFSCCLIHIDPFSSINKERGHMWGDVIVLEASGMLRDSLPEFGLAVRFSAGQLAVVLPDTDNRQAQEWAEEFRRKIEKHTFIGFESEDPITVSIGTITYPGDPPLDRDALLHVLVERTEYAASKGGNCVVSCSS